MKIVAGSLAENFIHHGIAESVVNAALIEAQRLQMSLIKYFVQHRLVAPRKLAQITAYYFGLPYVDISGKQVKDLSLDALDKTLLKKHTILPLALCGNVLELALVDPACQKSQDEVKFFSGLNIKPVIVDYDQLEHLLEMVLSEYHYTEIKQALTVTDNRKDKQVIHFVDQVLLDALSKNASDVHFEPFNACYQIRFRIDGILYNITEPPLSLAQRITARLKILGQLDIAERRLPQDGRFSFQRNEQTIIDCRLSSCPTIFGEKIVVRLLETNPKILNIDELGLDECQKKLFFQIIKRPQGMILVTGPTGSGKTVTLYTALAMLNQSDKNISTIEDPVEIRLPGINQLQINMKAELNFSTALRAFLRQDPDIIMVGEMRDHETVETAIKAAQTGHLVLSTLHTNSAAESLTRLINMGIAPFNITGSLTLIIAQRLIRKLCNHCKKQYQLPESVLLDFGFNPAELANLVLFEPQGCEQCTNGYLGRIGVYELLMLTPEVAQLILERASIQAIAEQAASQGMTTLYQSALSKVKCGMTSLTEVQRVVS